MAKKRTVVEGFWDRFDECVNEVGINRTALARQIGCGRKSLYNDYGGRSLSMVYIARFCSLYNYSSDYLLGLSKQKKKVSAV